MKKAPAVAPAKKPAAGPPPSVVAVKSPPSASSVKSSAPPPVGVKSPPSPASKGPPPPVIAGAKKGPPPPPAPPAPGKLPPVNPERRDLLSSIEGFSKKGLQKTVTKDRSAPLVGSDDKKSPSSPAGAGGRGMPIPVFKSPAGKAPPRR